VVEPTQLKNMHKSNWIMQPQESGVKKSKKIFELPPPIKKLEVNHQFVTHQLDFPG